MPRNPLRLNSGVRLDAKEPRLQRQVNLLPFQTRSGSGVAGVADARILAAYQAMAGANPPIPIAPAKLATRAVTGYPTALRWLKIHHPELLVSKPDEASVAPVAVAPAPPVVAPEPKPAPETGPSSKEAGHR
jgi:hypothetical protein